MRCSLNSIVVLAHKHISLCLWVSTTIELSEQRLW
jgi:hypothetical protein